MLESESANGWDRNSDFEKKIRSRRNTLKKKMREDRATVADEMELGAIGMFHEIEQTIFLN